MAAEENTKPCPMCGETIAATAKKCRFCNEWLDRSAAPPARAPNDAGLGLVVPFNVSPAALVAGYFGLFSILIVVAPIGLMISIVAIRDLKKHPEKHGWGRAIFGLVSSVVFTLILLAVLVSSAFHK